jgi:hypothetical protein
MKSFALVLSFVIVTAASAYDFKKLEGEFKKAQGSSRTPAAAKILGLKEGKVKSFGDQKVIMHDGEIYNLIQVDPEQVQELMKHYKK